MLGHGSQHQRLWRDERPCRRGQGEGTLNLTADPTTWANYGNIIKDFGAKYGLQINDFNPGGTSAEELSEITLDKGKSDEPDVVDVGTSFAIEAVNGEPGVFKGPILAHYETTGVERAPGHLEKHAGLLGLRLQRRYRHWLQRQRHQDRPQPPSPACCSPSSRARWG